MASSDRSHVKALMPITISLTGESVDMAVPPNVVLAELVPAMVKTMAPLDAASATRGYIVRTSTGRVLDQSNSLPDQEVRPGAVLTLEPIGSNSQDQRYDDLVEAVGTAVTDGSTPWEKTHSVQLSAHASAALVLLAAVMLATGSSQTTVTAAVGVAGAIMTTLAATVVARMPNPAGSLSLGHTAPILLAAAMFALVEGEWFSLPLAMAGCGLAVGSFTLLTLERGLRASLAAPLLVGLAFIVVGSLVHFISIAPHVAASWTVAMLVLLTLSAPWVAIARLPVTIGTSRDHDRIETGGVIATVRSSRVLVIALKVGASVAMITLTPLLTHTPASIFLLVAIALALMLSTRALRSAVEVLIGVLTGMIIAIVTAVAIPTVVPGALPWTLGAIITTAVLLVAANVVAPKMRPWLTRLADALGVVALLAILPLAAAVGGLI